MNDEFNKKKRGRYNTWKYNSNIKIPASTQRDHLIRQRQEEENSLNYIQTNFSSQYQSETTFQADTTQTQNLSSDENEQLEFNNLTSNQLESSVNDSSNSNEANEEINESVNNSLDSSEDDNENLDDQLNDLLRNEKITEEELAAAYLAAFFNGKTSQSSIKDFLQLSNISSNVKLPTSFDGLVKVLTCEKPKFMHSK